MLLRGLAQDAGGIDDAYEHAGRVGPCEQTEHAAHRALPWLSVNP